MSPIEFEEFEKISKEAWIVKIKETLKEQELEAQYLTLDDTISINPFLHHEDHNNYRPIHFQKDSNEWSIGDDIDLKDPVLVVNKNILDSLLMGANSLILQFPDEFSQWEELFNGVDLSMISLKMEFKDCLSFTRSRFWNNQKEILNACISFRDNSTSLEIISACMAYPHVKVIEIKSEKNKIVEQLTDVLIQIQESIDSLPSLNDISNKIFVELKLGKIYFVEIAKLRALKILWANLMKANGIDTFSLPYIISFPDPELLSEDHHYNMICTSSILMSGIIGGANLLYTPVNVNLAKDRQETQFLKRIARNVQNILMLESFFDQVQDPSAGSYYIEAITDQLVNQSWKELTDRISVK
jgi:methylmalonyl-CoA mutase